jgi:2-hydroxy-3-oxopropionate reductase
MMNARQTLGFIGVGVMGKPMSAHLVKAGYDVLVFDVSADAMAVAVSAGARAAASVREVCDQAEVVFTSLPSPKVFLEVMTAAEGVIEGSAVRIAVDTSTVGPRAARAAAEALRARGIELVDAPVSGGAAGALKASLAVIVSGSEPAVEAVMPILRVFGKPTMIGAEPGQAQLLKLLNNMLSSTALAVTAEAYVAGVKGGLDPKLMLDVLNISSGRSAASQEKFVRQVLPRTFDFGFPISSVCKDIGLAVDECEALGVPMWIGQQSRQLWNFAYRQGGGSRDMTEIVRFIEDWAGAEPPEPVRD